MEDVCFNPQLKVILDSDTPVRSSLICPRVYREHISSGDDWSESAISTNQCTYCAKLKINPLGDNYYCSRKCFLGSWKEQDLVLHLLANELDDGYRLSDKISIVVAQEGKEWLWLSLSRNYVPTKSDVGSRLKLECVIVNSLTGAHEVSSVSTNVTKPAIELPSPIPRSLVEISSPEVTNPYQHCPQPSNEFTFTILSYNILAPLYDGSTKKNARSGCPSWALSWEYRRPNLLQEIVGYDADIICLQEVRSVDYENFFELELYKCGYSGVYKKKLNEVCTGDQQQITDGCATFYRGHLFKEIEHYGLEYYKAAPSVITAMEPDLRSEVRKRLFKDNVALLVILEMLENSQTYDAYYSRICVANTHICSSLKLPEVKLYQVATLVNELEKFAEQQVPIVVCGDFNSLPQSDPYKYLVSGRLDPQGASTDPYGIYQHLKLEHHLHLASTYASFCLSSGSLVEEKELKKMNQDTGEPLFTNWGASGTLDYIFYTEDSLRAKGILELLDRPDLLGGLPSPHWSSDHVALMASLSFLRPTHYHSQSPRSWPPSLRHVFGT